MSSISKSQALDLLREQLSQTTTLRDTNLRDGQVEKWRIRTASYAARIFGKTDRRVFDFETVVIGREVETQGTTTIILGNPIGAYLNKVEGMLETWIDDIERFGLEKSTAGLSRGDIPGGAAVDDPLPSLTTIYDRFHAAARVLSSRQRERPFSIEDEYDVQDLLHALLVVQFDVVCPEEPTPKVGANYSKVDFLLPDYRIGIETKMMRPSLTLAKLSDDLKRDLIDFGSDSRIDTVHIFIYDPQSQIRHASQFEHGLSNAATKLKVHCFIRH